jgi:pimeloyl-ACP methyl ester carboxylesterase
MADLLTSRLVKLSLAAVVTPLKHAASEITVPILYVATRKDNAIPFPAQMAWANAAGARLVELDCGHSSFAMKERIPELVKLIGEMVEAKQPGT